MNYVYEMPENMLKDCAQKGTVERFEYDTFDYEEDKKALHKGAWVYLPYDYDKSKRYNVLYLLHGGGVTEDWWFKTFPDTVTTAKMNAITTPTTSQSISALSLETI